MRDKQRTNEQLKIELLSQWKLEAESRNSILSSMYQIRINLKVVWTWSPGELPSDLEI